MAGRQLDIERAKGLAILLVVFGHLVARASPPGVAWYEPLRIAVYLFHMPLFMYLSGYVAGLPAPARPWPAMARRRAERLLLPFAAFGLAVLCGKAAWSGYVLVDHAPADVLSGLRDLVWRTQDSPAGSIWFLAALFVFSVATPPALAASGGRLLPLAAAAAVLYAAPIPPYLYLDRVGTYFIFYLAGVAAGRHASAWRTWTVRWRAPTSAAFASMVVLCTVWGEPRFGFTGWPYKAFLLACGLLSMPAIHGWVRATRSEALLRLGGFSFSIYLLNTICIGAAKALLLRFVPWDGAAFLPFAAALMLAGVLGPIAARVAVTAAAEALPPRRARGRGSVICDPPREMVQARPLPYPRDPP